MLILGINAHHADASACLLQDGELVFAVEEERFTRVKHYAGFPVNAISACLAFAEINVSAISHIAVNTDPSVNRYRKAIHLCGSLTNPRYLAKRIQHAKHKQSLEASFSYHFPSLAKDAKYHHVEHHAAHLASCYFLSPFDSAVVVSIDGFGDFSSAAWGTGSNEGITVDGRIYFPHSLGIFYEALTQYLGFLHYGDEYKVMGLAAYGSPKYQGELSKIIKMHDDGRFQLDTSYFTHASGGFEYQIVDGSLDIGLLYSEKLTRLLGPARKPEEPVTQFHMDMACSIQTVYEQAFFNLLNALHTRYRLNDLALAGGCAMNSLANGKIGQKTPFKRVFIQPAAGDAGGAIGAALSVWHRLKPDQRASPMIDSYLGPEYDRETLQSEIDRKVQEFEALQCSITEMEHFSDLASKTATAIAEDKVVGWFQGRMEWGARALGNRSILADPRRTDMKDLLNKKIKLRESFRPFAPAILRDYVKDWFEVDEDVPFMMQVYPFKPSKRIEVPAVVHVDGTGRLQTVSKESNTRFYQLIDAFYQITGVPILLNTSFNENEPIVCTPGEAIECFLRTKMDVLVLGDFYVARND